MTEVVESTQSNPRTQRYIDLVVDIHSLEASKTQSPLGQNVLVRI